MITGLRFLAKRFLALLTGVLHPARRARARRIVEAARPVRSVLFLCLGNVCRSPYAEASFRRMAPGIRVASGGFIGPGRSSPELAQEVAGEGGLDLSPHVSQVVTAELARVPDLIVVMEPGQIGRLAREVGDSAPVVALGDLDPGRPERRRITDPWGKDPDVFRASFHRIDACLAELLTLVSPTSSSTTDRGVPLS